MAFTATTGNSAFAWRPDITTFAANDVVPEALIRQCAVQGGTIDGDQPALRVAYIDDDDAAFVAEADEIPEAQPTLAEITVYTGKISQLVRVSREQFTQDGTSGQLASSVARAIAKKADEAFLTQPAPAAGKNNPAAGILNHPGITGGGNVTTDLDPIVDLMAGIQAANGTPTHILLSPQGWAALRKLKHGDGSNQSLLGAGASDAQERLLSLPVIVSNAVPENTGVVLDRSAVVAAYGAIQVAQSADRYFESDSIALRCTWRVGQNLVRPDRVGTFTIGGAPLARKAPAK